MKFINSTPQFKKYIDSTIDSEFYYQGIFDRSVSSIYQSLASGKFPYNLKGNFAFFFKDSRRVVFAVDHATTYNMHWDDTHVSHIYSSLRNEKSQENPLMVRQRQIFNGTTIGNDTVIEGIKRLEPGTFFEKDLISKTEKIEYYIDLFHHAVDNNLTLNDVSKVFETVIEEQTREPFSLLWSSGTDSNCVLGFVKKLNRIEQCTLLSLYSDASPSDEKPQIEELEKTYGVKTNYYNLGKYVGITEDVKSRMNNPQYSNEFKVNYHRIWKGAQWEHSIFQKYQAMFDLKLCHQPMLTGEPGDLIFGNTHTKNILNTITQRPETTKRELAELFVCGDMWLQRRKFFRYPPWWKKFLEDSSLNSDSWNMAVDWVVNHFPDLKNSEDIVNDLDAMYYQFKASKLLYGYSQFSDINFQHPFLDYRVYFTMLSIPGWWKIKNGMSRQISYDIIKDHVDPRPWKVWPKSGIELTFLPKSRNVEKP
jgi:hypothetical protein